MLQKQFENFFNDIKIDTEAADLIEKRRILEDDIKDKLPGILENHDIELNKSNIRMIDQGSYKYNTTIKSDVVDRDVAVMIPLDTDENSDPRKIKEYLKDAITIPKRTVEIKEPCVRASYHRNGVETLHIDLPLYAKNNGMVYLARGKATSSNYSWENADPDGLNEYLCNHINGHDQLRRIICYLKKWKNEKYANASSDHQVPPSIGLTLLACKYFLKQVDENGKDDDLNALKFTMENIKNKFSCSYDEDGNIISANIYCYLPVSPCSDVFQKMRDSSSAYLLTFYKRLSTAVDKLINALNCDNEHDAALYVQDILGEDFEVPDRENKVSATVGLISKKEHGFG
ncbi:cyclic GMP-AMP synthase DncV-like nucleotidyltransferase [Megasphaera sp.]|uniref:cyclic GMP-AMP synthase DncV-like nucleotidyltransferase n=1 Tax=Megasphaera sp. TaxID=2023260 RepID=UPI003079C32E